MLNGVCSFRLYYTVWHHRNFIPSACTHFSFRDTWRAPIEKEIVLVSTQNKQTSGPDTFISAIENYLYPLNL